MNIKFNKKTILITSLCVLGFFSIILGMFLVLPEQENKRLYVQGMEFFNKKDYQNAYYNFKKISTFSKYYPLALLKEASSAEKLVDEESIQKKYSIFVSKYPNSVFTAKGLYAVGQSYYRQKKFKNAQRAFERLQDDFADSQFAIAANYYLAEIAEGKNVVKFNSKYYRIQYIEKVPDGRFALECASKLMKENKNSSEDMGKIAKAYFENGDYKSAYYAAQKAYLPKSWHILAMSASRLGMIAQAKAYFETGIKNYSRAIDKKELYYTIDAYTNFYGAGKSSWVKALSDFQVNKAEGEDYILYRLAMLLPKDQQPAYYQRIAVFYPKGDFASDAIWHLFWVEYSKRNYAKADELAQKHIANYPHTAAAPKVLFWAAKMYSKTSKHMLADSYFRKIIREYPDSFYAFRASEKIDVSDINWHSENGNSIKNKPQNISVPVIGENYSAFDKKLMATISEVQDYSLLEDLKTKDKFIQSWINYKKGNVSLSATQARDALTELEQKPDFNNSVFKLAYPIYYADEINYYAQKNSLDSYLLISLIREESYFNPNARSCVGAAGLMQIMPSTAQFIADKYSISYGGTFGLFNPEKNIKIGSRYFTYIKSELYNNDLYAVAAYNGGPGAVQSWNKSLKVHDFDEFVENIPYNETKEYVKKVYRSYWNYLNIYK